MLEVTLIDINDKVYQSVVENVVRNDQYIKEMELYCPELVVNDLLYSRNQDTVFIYSVCVAPIIDELRCIQKTSKIVSFMDKTMINRQHEKNMKELQKQFYKEARHFNSTLLSQLINSPNNCYNNVFTNTNSNCEHILEFVETSNAYVCLQCGEETKVDKSASSFNDVDRVNIFVKYMYDRRIHFRDCINQFQAKQNCSLPPDLHDNIRRWMDQHRLVSQSVSVEQRYSHATKEQISLFLKEHRLTKHYENIHLIHTQLTGQPPHNIAHLEEQLMNDFNKLVELYDSEYKHTTNRKNFINTQYVFFQLLQRHKYKCDRREFSILKTSDRKAFHDQLCTKLFDALGWNITHI